MILLAAAQPMLDSYQLLKTGSLYKSYARANPNESARVDNYWLNGVPTPEPATATGKSLWKWGHVYRSELNG